MNLAQIFCFLTLLAMTIYIYRITYYPEDMILTQNQVFGIYMIFVILLLFSLIIAFDYHKRIYASAKKYKSRK